VSDPPRISVCIVCRNEADRLGPCLESVEFADEVIVLDLESTDESAAVARAHGARVFSHEVVPVVEPLRNVVAAQATGDWILAMDPDERVTPGLAVELRRLAARESLDVVEIPFMNYDLGYPASDPMHRYDPKPRFYRRERISWPETPNALPTIDRARTHRLPDRDEVVMVHERNRTVAEAIERALRYAPAEAQAMVDRGEIFTARLMVRTLAGKAYKQFVVGRPWRDGVPGVLRAGILVAFHLYVWAAFWQLSGAQRTVEDDDFVRRIGRGVEVLRFPARVLRRPFRIAAGLRQRR